MNFILKMLKNLRQELIDNKLAIEIIDERIKHYESIAENYNING